MSTVAPAPRRRAATPSAFSCISLEKAACVCVCVRARACLCACVRVKV